MRPEGWRHSTHVLIGLAVLVVVAMVIGVAVLVTDGGAAGGLTDAARGPARPTAKPAVMPVADGAPKPTPAGLSAALSAPLANRDLGALTGRVTDALTGTQLWEQRSAVPMQPASTNKVLTAAARM